MGKWDFLPGELWIEKGSARDYGELERFHYARGRPATWAGVWVARYASEKLPVPGSEFRVADARVAGVAVVSWPTVRLGARERYLGMEHWAQGRRVRFVNEHVRTISRVIVHPQFRGIGVASELVRCILRECDTRYVEAVAAMGNVHPFFQRAGMYRVQGSGFGVQEEEKAYFVFDREEGASEKFQGKS